MALPFLAGETLTAARLQQELEAASSADLTIPVTTPTDVPGATLTFTTLTANAVAIVTASWDFRCTVTGTGYCYGEINTDGTVDTRKALFVVQSAETRLPGFLQKKIVLTTAGSHTIKLQGHKDINAGTALFCGGTTVLSIRLYA